MNVKTTAGGPPVAALLLAARRWFEDPLVERMRRTGRVGVTLTQAGVFGALDDEGTTVAELARRLGSTRQTVHQAVQGLLGAGLLEQVEAVAGTRGRPVRRSAAGRAEHAAARRVLDDLERELAARIGAADVERLRAVLSRPWGDPPR